MSYMSNLDLEIQDKIADTRLVRVDSFPNGRAYRWLVVLTDAEGDEWSVGIIEKTPNTRTEQHPYKSWVYFESIEGDMSAPNWVDERPNCHRDQNGLSDLSLVDNDISWCLIGPDDLNTFDSETVTPATRRVLTDMYLKIAENAAI